VAEHHHFCDCDACLNQAPIRLAAPPLVFKTTDAVTTLPGREARQRELDRLRRLSARRVGK
jgi:hypothetical protein